MIKIVLIGSGNLAYHLIKQILLCEELTLVQVVARHPKTISDFLSDVSVIADVSQIAEADLYIIAVSDSVIETISASLPFNNQLVVHTSGSQSIEVLSAKNRRGVLYPLQTFSKNKTVNFNELPFCIEAENEKDSQLLERITALFTAKFYHINSQQRLALHVSAVFASNFVNHLYQISEKICDDNQVPFELLHPLITETASKIKTLSPLEAQTGPAVRRDISILEKHISFLHKNKTAHSIYKLITDSIQKLYVQKL